MMQSTLLDTLPGPDGKKLHVALIMDGNGRWAQQRALPRGYGHEAGVKTVRRMIETAPGLGVTMLTLYAFSSDNWKRPKVEVSLLMNLLRRYLRSELTGFIDAGIRFVAIGKRNKLPADLVAEIEHVEKITAHGRRLTVRIALDYSSRDALLSAMKKVNSPDQDSISRALSGIGEVADVDLLIRTSGEQRLSDFLLWECAYAEFYFTNRFWPDFNGDDLCQALNDYRRRQRRFGAVPTAGPTTLDDARQTAAIHGGEYALPTSRLLLSS